MADTKVLTVPTGCLTIPSTSSRLRRQIARQAAKGYVVASQVNAGGKIVVTYTRHPTNPPPSAERPPPPH